MNNERKPLTFSIKLVVFYCYKSGELIFSGEERQLMGMIEIPIPKAPRAIKIPGYHFVKDSKQGEEESHGRDGTYHESDGS